MSTAIKVAAGQVVKTGAKALWGAAKGLYNAPKAIVNDAVSVVENPVATVEGAANDAISTVTDITKVAENPGESLSTVMNWFADEGVEGVAETLVTTEVDEKVLELAGDALVPRQQAAVNGTNCATADCTGAVFNKIHTFDRAASLIHGADGNIYGTNVSALAETLLAAGRQDLTDVLTKGANLFTGIENALFGDARGRILHAYNDEMEKFGVSRLRLSPVSALPRTAKLV